MERAKAMTLRGARCGGQSHPRTIKSVQMLALAGIVVTGSYDGTLISWDLASGERLCRPQYHSATVRTLALDEDWCVSGCSDGRVSVWTRPPGAKSGRYDFAARRRTLVVHKGPVSSLCLTRRYLYTYEDLYGGSWDGSIREVARATGNVRRTFYLGDLVMCMALSGEDRLLVAVGNSILCADLAARRGETGVPADASTIDEEELCELQLRHSCPITALTACPSGRFVFYGDDNGNSFVMDLHKPAACGRNPRALAWSGSGAGPRTPVTCLSFSFPFLLVTVRDSAFLVNVARDLGLEKACPLRGAPTSRLLSSAACRAAKLGDGWAAVASGASLDVFDFGRAAELEQARIAARAARKAQRARLVMAGARESTADQTQVGVHKAAAVARSLKLRKARQQVEALFWDS